MGYETCTCAYCGRREAMDLSREVRFAGEYGPLCDDCLPLALRVVEANAADAADAANASPDPALLALARLGAWALDHDDIYDSDRRAAGALMMDGCAPGDVSALAARLLAPDGAGEVADA